MLLLLIGTCIWQTAKADFGNCVIYEGKFYMKNGQVFKGCLTYIGEGEDSILGEDGLNEYCSDKGMLELLKKIQSEGNFWNWEDGGMQGPDDYGKVAIYKEIKDFSLKAMQNVQQTQTAEAVYGFVDEDEILFVDSSDVERIVFQEAYYSDRWWLTTELVVGQSEMMKTIQDQQYWNRLTVDLETGDDTLGFSNEWPIWGIEMINYNAKVNVAELKRLAQLKFEHLTDWKQMEAHVIEKYGIDNSGEDQYSINRCVEEGRERYFQELREWFWERGILIIQVWGNCCTC